MVNLKEISNLTLCRLANRAIIGVQEHLGLGIFARKFNPDNYDMFQRTGDNLVRLYPDDPNNSNLRVEFGKWPQAFVDVDSVIILVRPERVFDFSLEDIDYKAPDIGPQVMEVDLSTEEGNIPLYESQKRNYDPNQVVRNQPPRVLGLSTTGLY